MFSGHIITLSLNSNCLDFPLKDVVDAFGPSDAWKACTAETGLAEMMGWT